jgi:hypothetical protein
VRSTMGEGHVSVSGVATGVGWVGVGEGDDEDPPHPTDKGTNRATARRNEMDTGNAGGVCAGWPLRTAATRRA